MGDMVGLIIIFTVVFVVLKKGKDKKKRAGTPNVPRQNALQRGREQNKAGDLSKYAQDAAEPANTYYENQQKQRELKARLQNKYRQVFAEEQHYDILSRANANVAENSEDRLKRDMEETKDTESSMRSVHGSAEYHDKEEQHSFLEPHPADFMVQESGLMKELNDLMIMGYPAGISEERDFIAEGIAMINGYGTQERE